MIDKAAIEAEAQAYRAKIGGIFIIFPIEPDNPRSLYAFTTLWGDIVHVYHEALPVEEAAASLQMAIEAYEETFKTKIDWDRDVKFISTEAQVNADNVTMRRLRNSGELRPAAPTGYLTSEDVRHETEPEERYLFSARGLIKFMYLESHDTPKAAGFMDKYYQLLAMKKYGATAAHIRREVKRMTTGEAVKWIERTYSTYIHDDSEIFDLMPGLKK